MQIPHTLINKEKTTEANYHACIHLIIACAELRPIPEFQFLKTRLDNVIFTEKYIYIFEYKATQTAKQALQTIKDRGYADNFSLDKREIFLIGMNVDLKTKILTYQYKK